MLPTDHVLDEHLADRRAGRERVEDTDGRQHVGGGDGRPAAGCEQCDHLITGVDVARHDDRHARGGSGERGRVAEQHLGIASVGPSDQQDDVRAVGLQRGDAWGRSGPELTCTILAPADSPTRCPASAVTARS